MCKPGNACGCSGSGSGGDLLALLAVVAAVAVVIVFVLAHFLALAAAAVVVIAGTFGAVRFLARHIVPGARPRDQAAQAPPARRAITAAPRAIEAPAPAAVAGVVVDGDFLTGTPVTPVEPSHAMAQ